MYAFASARMKCEFSWFFLNIFTAICVGVRITIFLCCSYVVKLIHYDRKSLCLEHCSPMVNGSVDATRDDRDVLRDAVRLSIKTGHFSIENTMYISKIVARYFIKKVSKTWFCR